MTELEQSEVEQKKAFAYHLLKAGNDENAPFKAANAVIPNVGKALQVAKIWLTDPIVLAEKLKLIEDNPEEKFLPTKADLGNLVWDIAKTSKDEIIKLRAAELFGKIMNYIVPPQITQNNNNLINNGVMVVANHGTEDDWERKAVEQQARLTGRVC